MQSYTQKPTFNIPAAVDVAARRSRIGMAAAVFCLFPAVAASQVPGEFQRLNPDIQPADAAAAARWRLIDLTRVENGPLMGDKSYGINAADFDDDGDVDLVVAFQTGGRKIPLDDEKHAEARRKYGAYGTVYWLENVTERAGAPLAFRGHLLDDRQVTPKDAVILGPGKNGRRSVVIPCYLAGETVLYQTSDGRKWDKITLRSEELKQPVRAVVADVDGDGADDIVVTSIAPTGIQVAWFRQTDDADSSWEMVPIREAFPPLVGVDAGDVDGDGDVDIVCASHHAPTPFRLMNLDGRGTTWKKEPIEVRSPDAVREWVAGFSDRPLSQIHVRLADMDGDGDLDSVETSLKNGYLAWRENISPSQPWKFHAVARGIAQSYGVDAADIDHDGRLDLVVASHGGDGVYVFCNTVQHGFKWQATHLGGTGLAWPNIVRLVDLDRNGYVDVLATDFGRKAVAWTNPAGRQSARDGQ